MKIARQYRHRAWLAAGPRPRGWRALARLVSDLSTIQRDPVTGSFVLSHLWLDEPRREGRTALTVVPSPSRESITTFP